MVRRVVACSAIVLAVLGGVACGEDQGKDGQGNQLPTPTSGDVPHNNPQGGETGTDGTDTGSR